MLTTGPNLGLMDHGEYGERNYVELLRLFRGLDALTQAHVKSLGTTTPPEEPLEGDTYIVPAGATGDWADKDTQIARWTAKSAAGTPIGTPCWEFFVPKTGWQTGVDDLDQTVRFDGETWVGSGFVMSPDAPDDGDGRPDGTLYIQVAP